MKSTDEGQPSPFARPANKHHSPTSFQRMLPGGNGLRLPDHLPRSLMREFATIHSEAQQQSSHNPSLIDNGQISSSLQVASAETGYVTESVLRPTVPQVGNMQQGNMVYASIGQNVDPGSFEASHAQDAPFAQNMYGGGVLQPEAATTMRCAPSLSATPTSFYHPQPLNVIQPTTGLYGHSTAVPKNPIPSPSHILPSTAHQGNMMVAQFSSQFPSWMSPCAIPSQTAQTAQTAGLYGTPYGNLVHANHFGGDVRVSQSGSLSTNALAGEQPIGSYPTQPFPSDVTPSQNTQMKTHTEQAGSDGGHMQTPGVGGNLGQCQSQSIDVDNEANNLCGGVNRKVSEEPINLSNDTDEPKSLKKKGRKIESAQQQDLSGYRIPLKSASGAPSHGNQTIDSDQLGSNEGANKTRFQDPLCQPRRSPAGPPPRPFSSPAPTNSPIRRSSRNASSKNKKADIESTVSTQRAQPPHANIDVPLGGLGKDAREFNTETNGFRGRYRSTNKRRRTNGGTEVEGSAKESAGPCISEKRRNTMSNAKRRAKHDERNNKARKQASANPLTKPSTKEEAGDEDTDDLSEMIRNKRVPTIGTRSVPAPSHGDSPLSNTVGDASQSDDDIFNGAGNELTSDEEDDASAKTPSPQQRTPRKKASEAITINDSPVKTRILRTPKPSRTPRTSQTPRTRKATQASRGVFSKSRDIPGTSDGEYSSDSPEYCEDKPTKKPAKRKSKGKKTVKVGKTPSSPVNLVSPTPSGPAHTSVRRSPRNAKGNNPSKRRADIDGAENSDDDFLELEVGARTRRKTKSRTAGNDNAVRSGHKLQRTLGQRGPGTEGRSNRVEMRDAGTDSMDEEPQSPCNSSNDEDSDIAAEYPSQEQGSQPIDLNVRVVPKRKKAGPKVFREREFNKLSTDELAMIRLAFVKRYPSPPSNLQAQGRYEAAHGTEMTSGMVQTTWETQLKPWSERWWDFYLDFNTKVRQKKAAKPRNKDPTLKENEVKLWVEEYYREHGDAKPNVTHTATEIVASTNTRP